MRTTTIPRYAGVGLLVYTLTTLVGFLFGGAPGGDYADARVVNYIDPGRAAPAFVIWYIVALGGLALVAFGAGIRRLPGIGQPVAALATIGAALSVTGAMIAGGVVVAMIEGGSTVREQTPHAAVYVVTEIGAALIAVCGPALCVGTIEIVLAMRATMPAWLRVACLIGGICGIFAPFFFTYFVFILVTLGFGIALAVGRAVRSRISEPAASIV